MTDREAAAIHRLIFVDNAARENASTRSKLVSEAAGAARPGRFDVIRTMTKAMIVALVGAGLLGAAQPALAQEAPATAGAARGNQEFLGVDLDSGDVYYNGRNSGRYCLYRTVDVFNRYTGYVEPRRVRRCGRGLYLP